jgi:hypothetical protein
MVECSHYFGVPYFHTKMRNKKRHSALHILSLWEEKLSKFEIVLGKIYIHHISNWVLEGVCEGGHFRNSGWPSANELDLGLPTVVCQVGSAVVFQIIIIKIIIISDEFFFKRIGIFY